MFDSVRSHTAPEKNQSQPAEGVMRPQIGDPDVQQSVYTLPKEFLPKKRFLPTASGGGSFFASWKVIALLIGIVVVMIGIVGVLVYWVMQQNETASPQAFPLPTAANTNTTVNTSLTNAGTALNLNVNQGLNGNINAGLFPAVNSNANTNANANTSTTTGIRPFSVKTTVPLAEDRDKDQLSDAEEALYGTKVGLPDSDGDGFIDGSEVLRGYSPIDPKKTLRAGGVVLPFVNSSFGWSMDYPAKWVAGSSDDASKSVLFTSDAVEGEYVQVVMTDNPQGLTAKEWYASLFTDADPTTLQEVTIAGLSGIISPDGYTYYLADTNNIIGIIYNYGTKNAVSFKTTFQMMVTSFAYDATTMKKTTPTTGVKNGTLTPSIPETPTNTKTNTNSSTNTNTTSNANSNKNTNTTTTNANARNANLNSNTNTNTVRTIQ